MSDKLKPGYKQTEVGVIPEEWEVKRLHEVTDLQVGFAFKSEWFGKHYGPRLLRGDNVGYGSADWSDARTLVGKNQDEFRSYILNPGDVVIGMDRTFTKSGSKITLMTERDCPCLLVQRVGRFEPRKCEVSFLWFVLSSETIQSRLRLEQKGMDIPHLSRTEILHPFALFPPLSEQRAIAEALGDVDALLGGLERLIAKKRDLKQAAMQQLLTGQTRLPGFTGEWEVKTLGDLITHCFSGATPRRNRPDFYNGNIRWITSGELNYNVITDTIEKITPEAVARTNLTIIPKGTFLMAITGLEAAGTRGSCGIVGEPSATNQSCMAVFPTRELVTEYLFHYYVFRGDALALEYCQGTKQQSYTAKLVKKLPINVPPKTAEQTAIASVLTEMDGELAVLEQRREKTLALKQAMMQELLTGRTRLV